MADTVVELQGKFTAFLAQLATTGNRTAPAAIGFVTLDPDDGIITDFSGLLGLKVRCRGPAPVLDRSIATDDGIVGKTGRTILIKRLIAAGCLL